MRQEISQIIQQLIPPLLLALGSLLCVLVGFATNYIASKTKNTKVQQALARLDQVMEDAVKSAQQTVVSSIKPGDDMAKTLAEAKAAALASVESHYGPKGIDELKTVLGWDDLEKNLSTKLEAKVHDLKMDKTAAGLDSPYAKPAPLPPVA